MGVLILAKYKTVEDFVLKYLIREKKSILFIDKKGAGTGNILELDTQEWWSESVLGSGQLDQE